MTRKKTSTWMGALKADPLPWLLQKNNPCVRYRTLTDVLDRPETDSGVREARDATWGDPLVTRLLGAVEGVGPFPDNTVWWQKLFKGNYGDLDTLYRLGIPKGSPVIDEACDRWLSVEIPPDTECYPKQMIGGLVRYADPDDKRLKKKIKYVTDNEPFVDGNRPGVLRYAEGAGGRASCCGSHSCYSAAMRALWAVMGIDPQRRSKEARAFIDKGAAFLSAHNLYQPSHGDRRPIKDPWLELHLPFGLGWQVDLLEVLDIASQIGLHEQSCMFDGLRELLSKQTKKGRWLLDARVPYDDGRLVSLVKDAEPVGAESKWVTLSALRVLKRCEGLLEDVSKGVESPAKKKSLTPGC